MTVEDVLHRAVADAEDLRYDEPQGADEREADEPFQPRRRGDAIGAIFAGVEKFHERRRAECADDAE